MKHALEGAIVDLIELRQTNGFKINGSIHVAFMYWEILVRTFSLLQLSYIIFLIQYCDHLFSHPAVVGVYCYLLEQWACLFALFLLC